jgi:hypothetical protein
MLGSLGKVKEEGQNFVAVQKIIEFSINYLISDFLKSDVQIFLSLKRVCDR